MINLVSTLLSLSLAVHSTARQHPNTILSIAQFSFVYLLSSTWLWSNERPKDVVTNNSNNNNNNNNNNNKRTYSVLALYLCWLDGQWLNSTTVWYYPNFLYLIYSRIYFTWYCLLHSTFLFVRHCIPSMWASTVMYWNHMSAAFS